MTAPLYGSSQTHLGWLLSPQGRHGAGPAFLEGFLARLGPGWQKLALELGRLPNNVSAPVISLI